MTSPATFVVGYMDNRGVVKWLINMTGIYSNDVKALMFNQDGTEFLATIVGTV